MKKVEQDILTWNNDLGNILHQHLDYHAYVILRDKFTPDKEKDEGFTKVEFKKPKQNPIEDKHGKIIYCADYNAGTCAHSDNHEGRFSNRRVTKFHIWAMLSFSAHTASQLQN